MSDRRRGGPGNVPTAVADFVGRTRELADTRKLLATARLVTLVGVGGVGKTCLALRLARTVAHLYPHGVWLVELADLPETAGSSLVEQAAAAALGIKDFSVDRPRDAVADYLRDRTCLVVLDNCEHLAQEVGMLVSHLLRAAPRLTVLATSREVLGCGGEHLVQVPPLSLPSRDGTESVPSGEALELLRRRAEAVGAPLRTEDLAAAARLCRELDGIPLAIELAAGRLNTLTVPQVVERLDDRFGFLTGGPQQGPATHRPLRKVLDWSYHLCSQREKLLWERVSVFSGGFTLDAAEQVCAGNGIGSSEILDILTGLVRQSLITVASRGRRAHYRQLETVRHYGLRALAARDAVDDYRSRHRAYYLRQAHAAADDWFSTRELRWLKWAQSELPNLRAAMEHGLTDSDPEAADQGLRIAVSLTRMRIWFFLGWPGEGRAWLERGLAALGTRQRWPNVSVLTMAGWISLCQGDPDSARRILDECDRTLSRHTERSAGQRFLAATYALLVNSDPAAIDQLSDVLHTLRAGGALPADTAMVELFWAMSASFLGDRDTALTVTEECFDNARRQGAAWQISWARWTVGLAQMRHGDQQRALIEARESLRCQLQMNDHWGTVWGTLEVAWVLAAQIRANTGRETDPGARRALAVRTARLLGGAARLRERTGARLAGLGPFHHATGEAADTARRVLGEQSYKEAFREGTHPGVDYTDAYQDILLLALGQRRSPASSPEEPKEPHSELLTPREREIAGLVAEGMTNVEIARNLMISTRTVQTHVGNILRKRALRNRQDITIWYSHHNPAAIAPPNTASQPPEDSAGI